MVAMAPDTAQKALDAKLREMRPRFLQQVRERLDRMEELFDQFAEAPGPGPVAEELAHAAHKLAGISAMFGASEIGDLARGAESSLGALAQDPGAAGEALDWLEDLLGEMALMVEG